MKKRTVVGSRASFDGAAHEQRAAVVAEAPRLIIRTCKHILEGDTFCRQPAVAGRKFCRAHLELRLRSRRMARARYWHSGVKLPRLTSLEAVEVARTRVAVALAFGHVDPDTARVLRWGLMQSAAHIRLHGPAREADDWEAQQRGFAQ
jgi:hypothetical protein